MALHTVSPLWVHTVVLYTISFPGIHGVLLHTVSFVWEYVELLLYTVSSLGVGCMV